MYCKLLFIPCVTINIIYSRTLAVRVLNESQQRADVVNTDYSTVY